MSRPSNRIKRIVSFVLKFGFVAGLLFFLAKKGFLSLEATRRAFTRLDLLLPAMCALFATTLLTITRWQWLLRAQDIVVPWKRTAQLVCIGNFFNIALPGAVSGDFVKAFYVAKEVKGQRGRAFGSILFDRLAGLSALVLVSAGALILDFSELEGTALLKGISFMILIAALGVVVFFGYLFLMREQHDPLLKIFRSLESRFKKAGSFVRIYEGIRHYHHHRWTVAKALGVSVAIHLIVAWAFYQFAHSLDQTQVYLPWVFIIVPMGLLATAVPLGPAGVGTGHAAFYALFLFLGTERGADIFNLFVFTQLLIGGVGGLIYLRFKAHAPQLVLEPQNAP